MRRQGCREQSASLFHDNNFLPEKHDFHSKTAYGGASSMIARVALEIALEKEFDYLVPAGMESEIHVGSRVRIHFGNREVLGCVTCLVDEPAREPGLKPILKI